MLIELDITHRCNLGCVNCNRLCGLVPRDDTMSVDEVDRFCAESEAAGVRWTRVAVLGGEPTLHPDLGKILVSVSKVAHEILLVTNGLTGVRSAEDLGLPAGFCQVQNTAKHGRVHEFAPMTDAVIDSKPDIPTELLRAGCPIPQVCGLALDSHGYYPCPIAGPVDQVFGLGLALPTLAGVLAADSRPMFERTCRYCGHFWDVLGRPWVAANEPTISPSWAAALRQFPMAPAETRH